MFKVGYGDIKTIYKNCNLYMMGGMSLCAMDAPRRDKALGARTGTRRMDHGGMSLTEQSILLERPLKGVAVLRLHRPQVLNAMDLAMQSALDAELSALESDDSVRAVVLTGSGDRAFSTGYDIQEMQYFDRDFLLIAQLKREPWIWHIANYRKPLLGAINGIAHGAGAIIAAALDIRVGGPKTEFRFTAARYGAANNTWQLAPIVGFAKAKEILMTGRKIGAEEAMRAGLLTQLVADTDVLGRTLEIAVEIAENPPEGVRHTKALLHANLGATYADAYRAENAVMMNELAPRPPAELFEDFLQKHSRPR